MKVSTPIGVDDIEWKISNDYANIFDQTKQRLSNDSKKLKSETSVSST